MCMTIALTNEFGIVVFVLIVLGIMAMWNFDGMIMTDLIVGLVVVDIAVMVEILVFVLLSVEVVIVVEIGMVVMGADLAML